MLHPCHPRAPLTINRFSKFPYRGSIISHSRCSRRALVRRSLQSTGSEFQPPAGRWSEREMQVAPATSWRRGSRSRANPAPNTGSIQCQAVMSPCLVVGLAALDLEVPSLPAQVTHLTERGAVGLAVGSRAAVVGDGRGVQRRRRRKEEERAQGHIRC